MMKSIFVTLILIFQSAVCFASGTFSRSVFNFEEKNGDIKTLQVDLEKRDGNYFANVKSLLRDKRTRKGLLVCGKVGPDEFSCNRDDGGGGFSVIIGDKPRITFAYFYAGDEEENIKATLSANPPVTIEGKKVVIAKGDAF